MLRDAVTVFVEFTARPVLRATSVDAAREHLANAPMPSPVLIVLEAILDRFELPVVLSVFGQAEREMQGSLPRRARRLGAACALELEHALQTHGVTRRLTARRVLDLWEAKVEWQRAFWRPSFVTLTEAVYRLDVYLSVLAIGLEGDVHPRSRAVLAWLCEEVYTLTAAHFRAARTWIAECAALLPERPDHRAEGSSLPDADAELDPVTRAAVRRTRAVVARITKGG